MAQQQSKKEWSRRLPFRTLSLQSRLPLVFCLLMLVVLVIFGITSYLTVKNSSEQAGQDRLRSLTTQVSALFAQSTQNLLAVTRNAASQDALEEFVRSGDSTILEKVNEAVQPVLADSSSMEVLILNHKQQIVWKKGRKNIAGLATLNPKWLNSIDSARIGDLYRLEDSIYYPIVVAIKQNDKVIGHMIRWRMLRATPRTLHQISELMGANSAIYIGNGDGKTWTNLIIPTSNPFPEEKKAKGDIYEYDGVSGPIMATTRPIAQTPWILLVEFSVATVQEASDRFLHWLIIIGSLLIIAGSFIAWLISRNMTSPLKKLTNAASSLAHGDYTVAVETDRHDEIGKLSRAFNAMTNQVKKAHDELEKKIAETASMNEQLRDLSAHLQNIREEERIHIAREMHDQLGQLLTSFKMDVFMLKKKLGVQIDPIINEKLGDLEKNTDEAVMFVRKLAAELRPGLLDDLGLIPALEWHSKEFEKRFGVQVNFKSNTKELSVSPEIATGVFRIYQESLTNIARHADAKNVVADLEKNGVQLKLRVSDNGKGFPSPKTGQKKTLGLLGMKERAHMIGGKLDISSEQGKGTTITIVVPMQSESEIGNSAN